MKYDLPRNIITLLNAFNLPEDNITASNYEAAFNQLNSSSPETVFGLDIKTCDMQTLLSEVTTSMNTLDQCIQVIHFSYSYVLCF